MQIFYVIRHLPRLRESGHIMHKGILYISFSLSQTDLAEPYKDNSQQEHIPLRALIAQLSAHTLTHKGSTRVHRKQNINQSKNNGRRSRMETFWLDSTIFPIFPNGCKRRLPLSHTRFLPPARICCLESCSAAALF